jgi:RNA-binding protein
MELTEKQKKHLRRLAHDLKPVIQVGNSGVSAGLSAELRQALDHHELVKVKLRVGDRQACNAAIDAMIASTSTSLVAYIGNTAILYRRREKNPGIQLP